MQLTNKTKKKYFWREAGNRFFIEVDGKPVEFKFSLAQHEKYKDYLANEKIKIDQIVKDKAENNQEVNSETVLNGMLDQLNNTLENASEIVEIALNPKRDEVSYTKEQVLQLFDENIDLMKIVSRTYVDKKIFNPALDSLLDPELASGM